MNLVIKNEKEGFIRDVQIWRIICGYPNYKRIICYGTAARAAIEPSFVMFKLVLILFELS